MRKIVKELLLAEEQGRIIAENLAERLAFPTPVAPAVAPTVVAPPTTVQEKKRTRTREDKNYGLGGEKKKWLEQFGSGKLAEFVVLSTSKDYECTVLVDDATIYSGNWDYFNALSEYTEGIVARLVDSTYVLNLSDIEFSNVIRIYLQGTITLTRVYAKYALHT